MAAALHATTSILFVCLGNICRSPMAQGIFRTMAQQNGLGEIRLDSCGTGGWHIGDPPDSRAIAKVAEYGVDISDLRARQIAASDFDRFDLILTMDSANFDTVTAQAPADRQNRVHRFLQLTLDRPEDVPDPYYGGPDGFEQVYRMLAEGSAALQARILSDRTSP